MDPSCAFKYFIPEPEDPGKHKQKASRAVPSWAAHSTHACAGQAGRAAARALALLLRPLLLSAMPSGCSALPASVMGAAAPEKPRGGQQPLQGRASGSSPGGFPSGGSRAGLARTGPGRGSLVLASQEWDLGGEASYWPRENRTQEK